MGSTVLLLALLGFGCAGLGRPPETGSPRPTDSPYPVVVSSTPEQLTNARAAWALLAREHGLGPNVTPEFLPATATIRTIAGTDPKLRLPRIGGEPIMSEDDMRESLRRFIASARALIGADSQQLSLVESSVPSDTAHLAVYEQRAVRFPLRNGFGILRIAFTPSQEITGFNNTCLPNLGPLQRTLGAIQPAVTAEQAGQAVVGQTFTFSDSAGSRQYTVPNGEKIDVRQLVMYPVTQSADNSSLEIHLAWEIKIGQETQRTVYLDAVNSAVLGTA
jgi:hypothetical protein